MCYWCLVIESACFDDAKNKYFFISRVHFSYHKYFFCGFIAPDSDVVLANPNTLSRVVFVGRQI